MKKIRLINRRLLLLVSCLVLSGSFVIGQEDSVAPEPVVKLHYYNIGNGQQYLILESMLKKGKELTPQQNIKYSLYLDSAGDSTLIGMVETDASGKAKAFIPPSLKMAWDTKDTHVFVVKSGEEEVISDFSITKARVSIDTASEDGVRSIIVSVQKKENEQWIPVAEAELKVGFRRLGGILSAGEDLTYTTDSSGMVTVEVNKENLPGDEKGNLIIAAKLEDHEELGNLLAEQTVGWGTPLTVENHFFEKRTLWSTRFRTPAWLLVMAYGIVLGVWGTLIYLLTQLIKIKKLGKTAGNG